MKITLSRTDMLKRRRSAGGLEPLRQDFVIERTDGIDVDEILAQQLRQWYLALLDNADKTLLAPDNIAPTVVVSMSADELAGGAKIKPPSMCRRVFDVRLKGWARAAEVLPYSELDRTLALQLNPYTAATADNPVAVSLPGSSSGVAPEVVAWPPAVQAVSVIAVVDPGEEFYTFDESALSTMPSGEILLDI